MANTVPAKDLHRIVLSCFIYNDEGKYLIIKRAPTHKAFPNKWAVPGGGLEQGDYINNKRDSVHSWFNVLEKVLRREVREETGLEIESEQYFGNFVFIRPDNIAVLVIRFAARKAAGDVVLEDGDSTEYAWVTAKEAATYDLIGNMAQEFRDVDSLLNPKP
ncbi:MAG: NUDIX hydrolase [bacterium]|nr:NUDIX hydrolase [bacterium]